MFYVVKKHISVIINKAPYPAKPLMSVEAVWEELQLVSDLRWRKERSLQPEGGCHCRCGWTRLTRGDHGGWSRLRCLCSWAAGSVQWRPSSYITWWFSCRERHIKAGVSFIMLKSLPPSHVNRSEAMCIFSTSINTDLTGRGTRETCWTVPCTCNRQSPAWEKS